MMTVGPVRSLWFTACALVVSCSLGCSGGKAAINEPTRYKTTSALKERLLEVAKYGDGGSSLGGIEESIAELMKEDAEKGKKLKGSFQRLNTTNSKDERKKIAKEMADQLE